MVPNDYYWPYAIYPYVKSRQVYKCANDNNDTGSSYLINSCLGRQSMATIDSPAEVVALSDGHCGDTSNRPTFSRNDASSYYGLNEDYTIAESMKRLTRADKSLPRHTQRNNFIYADGHVKASPQLPVWTTANAAAAKAQMETVVPFLKAIKPPGPSYSIPGNAWDDF